MRAASSNVGHVLLAAGLLSCFAAAAETTTPPAPELSAQQRGLLTFPACVDLCVFSAGCRLDNARCICRSAASAGLLDSVVRCMPRSCVSRAISAEDSFISIVENGCRAQGQPVPAEALSRARSLAASLGLLRPPPATTTTVLSVGPQRPTTTTTRLMSSPLATTGAPTSVLSSTVQPPPSPTQTAPGGDASNSDRDGSSTTGSSSTSSTSNLQTVPTQPPTPADNTPTQAPAPAHPPPSDPTDSSPFATPRGAGSRSKQLTLPWALASAVAGIVMLIR